MKAVHGGKTKNDRLDAEKIALLLRGGMLPQAYAYPKEMRATRDLLRRRSRLVRIRSEFLGHIQLLKHQHNLPAFDKAIAYRRNRQGISELFSVPEAKENVALDVRLIDSLDVEIRRQERYIVERTKVHDVESFDILRTVDGIGPVLSMTMLYEIENVRRFNRVQRFISYARLVKGQKESAGKKLGTTGAKMGNRHLKWAFSEAAVLFLRNSERAKKYVARARAEARQGESSFDPVGQARPGRLLHASQAGALRRGAFLCLGLTGLSMWAGAGRAGSVTAAP